MGLPFTFLLGLLVLFASLELSPPVPGSGSLDQLLVTALLVPVPTLLVLLARRLLRARLLHATPPAVPPRWLLRASRLASPLVLFVLLVHGGLVDLVERWVGDSHLAELMLMLGALLLVELPRLVCATATAIWCELDDEVGKAVPIPRSALPGFGDLWPVLRLRLGWPLLLLLPCLMLGASLDLAQLDREWYAFLLGTSPGSILSALGFLVVAAAILPSWFRIAFATSPRLPEPAGALMRRTAASLGFRPSRVLLLPTGMRAMNAMMVGPLPIGRCLCVTDGLVRTLDGDSLAGVVAHEVGHARMEHPGLLMTLAVVIPMLLLGPVQFLQVDSIDVVWQAMFGVAAMVFVWSLVRALAHRFEHEADIASVQALGASPCTRALMVVSRMAMPVAHGFLGRIFSLHPEESHRCAVMRRYEADAGFRSAFDRTGRRLRLGVLGALTLATAIAASAWYADWPYERTLWRFQSGDIATANELSAAIGDEVPERWRETWSELRAELAAAVELAPDARDWPAARPLLDRAAWQRGVEVLLVSGPAAARPWLALAMAAEQDPPAWRLAVYEYCRAAHAADPDRMEAAKLVVRRLGIPLELQPVFGS